MEKWKNTLNKLTKEDLCLGPIYEVIRPVKVRALSEAVMQIEKGVNIADSLGLVYHEMRDLQGVLKSNATCDVDRLSQFFFIPEGAKDYFRNHPIYERNGAVDLFDQDNSNALGIYDLTLDQKRLKKDIYYYERFEAANLPARRKLEAIKDDPVFRTEVKNLNELMLIAIRKDIEIHRSAGKFKKEKVKEAVVNSLLSLIDLYFVEIGARYKPDILTVNAGAMEYILAH